MGYRTAPPVFRVNAGRSNLLYYIPFPRAIHQVRTVHPLSLSTSRTAEQNRRSEESEKTRTCSPPISIGSNKQSSPLRLSLLLLAPCSLLLAPCSSLLAPPSSTPPPAAASNRSLLSMGSSTQEGCRCGSGTILTWDSVETHCQ